MVASSGSPMSGVVPVSLSTGVLANASLAGSNVPGVVFPWPNGGPRDATTLPDATPLASKFDEFAFPISNDQGKWCQGSLQQQLLFK